MSAPGWYPDPSGPDGQARYWDGRAWTAQTRNLGQAGGTAGRPGSGGRGPGRTLTIGLVALVVVAAVVVAFVLWPRTGTPGTDDTMTARPTGSVWDEKPSDSPTPTPSDTGGELAECPRVDREESSRGTDTHAVGTSGWGQVKKRSNHDRLGGSRAGQVTTAGQVGAMGTASQPFSPSMSAGGERGQPRWGHRHGRPCVQPQSPSPVSAK